MKRFEMQQIYAAYEYAEQGGQALHIHNITQGHPLFRRYKQIAHLIDMDKDRLIATARRLGVRVIKVGREGRQGQHIDLCGKPFEKACKEAVEQCLQPTINGLGELPAVVEQSENESPAVSG